MADSTENTFTAYLGPEFQQRLMWQLLVEPEFAEKTIPNLAIEYFDDPNLKRLFIIMLEYFKEYEKVPNLQNQSIHQAINKYKTPNNLIEEESLFSVIKRITLWNERILNKEMLHDGSVVQKETNTFIKQQEWRKFAEFILDKTKNGEIRRKHVLGEIDEKIQRISHIGDEEDYGTEVIDNIEKALRKEFRQPIPTGVDVLDAVTGGGLGKGEIGVILTPSGVGKAQPLSSKVLTPNGWIKMGDIKVDDLVIGSNGKSQKVLGVFPQGKRDIYRIDFTDNTSVLCDKEHIWSVNTHKQRTDKHKLGGITYYSPDNSYVQLTVNEMMNDYILSNNSKTVLNYRLPNIQPVEFIEKDVKIHPYVMGVLLGDGCLSKNNQPHITTTDKFVVDRVRDLYEKTKVVEFEGRGENYLKIYKILLLDSKLHLQNDLNLYGKLSYEKEIPEIYLFNSIKNREALLQGLIDSDGTVSSSGTIIYSTTSNKLALQVRELVLSLGGTCVIKNKNKQYNKSNQKVYGRESYDITISFPETANIQPCLLPRKLKRVRYRIKYANKKFICNIVFSHEEEAQCIYVENDDHLYVTDDYILTHNTTLLTKIANYAYEAEKNVLQVIFEDTTEQIQRKHYAIWSKVPLSKMDDEEENKKAFKICSEKAESMKGKGVLLIKRFSQENTTMLDIRNWMIRHQKKTGIKFDILILDYLDCLESHKKTPDRTEAELQIIKSFEALASDFDIPAWTAIQSNRSGFDSQYVEAHQTGGSIKRIQKAHLFMSVAKTKEQKEAQLANIRIIKARFAQDGQTFDDAIFNNDTMEIRIEDSRYKYAQVNKYAKHYGEKDIENLEENSNEMSKIHSHLSDFQKKSIDKANDNSDDVTIGDVVADIPKDKLVDYKTAYDSMYNGSNENNNTVSGDIEGLPKLENFAIRSDNAYPFIEKPKDDILEIDTANDIVNEGINEGITDGVNSNIEQSNADAIAEIEKIMRANVDDAPFEWNGESGTTANEIVVQPEVKIEDINKQSEPVESPRVEKVSLDSSAFVSPGVDIHGNPKKIEIEPVSEEKKVQLIDPDEEKSHPSVFKMLEEYRKKQGNIRKE